MKFQNKVKINKKKDFFFEFFRISFHQALDASRFCIAPEREGQSHVSLEDGISAEVIYLLLLLLLMMITYMNYCLVFVIVVCCCCCCLLSRILLIKSFNPLSPFFA